MQLPGSIDEISVEWLQSVLTAHEPDVEVASVEKIAVIHGSATKIRLRIGYAQNTQGGLPATVWLKIGFEPHSELIRGMEFYDVEAICYGKLLPQFGFNTPKCYFHRIQADPPQVALILEDLAERPARCAIATEPITVKQAAAALTELARIHAATWNSASLGLTGLRPVLSWGESIALQEFVTNSVKYFSVPRGFSVPVVLHDRETLSKAWEQYLINVLEGPQCLVHGDAHVGNTFFEADGTVGFLDWQCASIGNWSHDVGYLLVTGLDVPVRRAAEMQLLQGYLDDLERLGVHPPTFEDALRSYRRSMIFTFVIWLGNGDEFQSPQVNNACFARAGAAIVDHGGFAGVTS